MYLNENYLHQLITQFSGPKDFLRQLCEEEKRKTQDIINNMVQLHKVKKESLVKQALKLFKCDTSAFKKHLSDSKHELQLMENDDPDHDLLKGSLGLSTETKEMPLKSYSNKNIALRTHRIKSNEELCDCPNFLFLHGTRGCNVEGILKEGLRPSSYGTLGPGIYLTNSFEIAHPFGQSYVKDEGTAKHVTYLFVNKVKETLTSSNGLCRECKKEQSVKICQPLFVEKNSSTFSVKSSFKCRGSSFKYEPVLKVFDKNGPFEKLKQSANFKLDSDGNKILFGTFQVVDDETRIALAHHDLVTLAYLIEIEIEQSARELAKQMLYCDLHETKFTNNPMVSEPLNGSVIDNSSAEDCSMNSFVVELEKEINANQRAEVELAKQKLECKVNSYIQQLLFNTSSIIKTNPSVKYKAELLQTSNQDYEFVLRSMNERNTNGNSTVVQIYRINQVDKSEVENMRDGLLYMHGVKADKVLDVLAGGYPASRDDLLEQCKCGSEYCYCDVSTDLDFELTRGTSHCVTNGRVGKMSFVFLVREGKSAEPSSNSDTRGCCFKTSEMVLVKKMTGFIPAYLVVFSLQ